MKTHVLWHILVIVFLIAFVIVLVYNKELEKSVGERTQGIVWVFISMACLVSIRYFTRN